MIKKQGKNELKWLTDMPADKSLSTNHNKQKINCKYVCVCVCGGGGVIATFVTG